MGAVAAKMAHGQSPLQKTNRRRRGPPRIECKALRHSAMWRHQLTALATSAYGGLLAVEKVDISGALCGEVLAFRSPSDAASGFGPTDQMLGR